MKFWLSLFCCLMISGLFAQTSEPPRAVERNVGPPPVEQLAGTITAAELERHLRSLAGREFEGRETGTKGQRMAAEYIAQHFEGFGLPALGEKQGYYQKIAFVTELWDEIDLQLDGNSLRHLWDFYAIPANNRSKDWQNLDQIVFLGYGIDDEQYSDYQGADLKGKTILIYPGEPRDQEGRYLISGSDQTSEWSADVNKKLMAAYQHGVELVLIIDDNFKQNVSQARKQILNRSMQMVESIPEQKEQANNLFLSSEIARKIVGKHFKQVVKARKRIQKKGKSKAVTIPVDLRVRQLKLDRQLMGENVLGYIEGTDPELKNELIVITAHYDHLGKRGDDIYFGADDNGSGTATVLEIAQAFAKAKELGWGPRRSVLVMLVSGEEKGLLGSQYYVNFPLFPLGNTVANINVDMVGRVDAKHADNPNYIYVIGSDRLSTELHQINEEANARYTQLELDYTYNAEDDPNRYYYRSDHYNFAEKGIPAIFYFNGTHEDYHRTTDTVDKINFEKMVKIGQLVFYTAWELANRDERIKVDVKSRP